jgi:predicted transcriptional regulator
LERIEKSPAITNQSRAKLVYAAGHVVEASRQGKATYRAPKDLIARNAGVSVRTVTKANAELAAAGLIVIQKHFNGQRKQYDVIEYGPYLVRRL